MAEQTLNDKTAPKGLTTQVIMSSTNSHIQQVCHSTTAAVTLSLCGHFHCEQQCCAQYTIHGSIWSWII